MGLSVSMDGVAGFMFAWFLVYLSRILHSDTLSGSKTGESYIPILSLPKLMQYFDLQVVNFNSLLSTIVIH